MELSHHISRQNMTVTFCGDFVNYTDDKAKESLYDSFEHTPLQSLDIDCTGLQKWDSTLVVIICELIKEAKKKSVTFQMTGFPDSLKRLVDLAFSVNRNPPPHGDISLPWLEGLGSWGVSRWHAFCKGIEFIKQTFASLGRMFIGKAVFRRVDFLFALEDCSYKAIAIVSVVSFMVGLILAFVGAIQLRIFGVEIYVASLVAIGMTRIMGAIMTGIIMSGRTGASYAATIGTMQVNEEIDALRTMGIPVTDFLVLPRISSLIITMPILTMLSDFMGVLGGAAVGVFMLDISVEEYWKYTYAALKIHNFLVGLFHGFIYGFVIAICGCYYGVNCGRNADSVGVATTKAVVSSIVWMILVTGLMTVIFEEMGL